VISKLKEIFYQTYFKQITIQTPLSSENILLQNQPFPPKTFPKPNLHHNPHQVKQSQTRSRQPWLQRECVPLATTPILMVDCY